MYTYKVQRLKDLGTNKIKSQSLSQLRMSKILNKTCRTPLL